ncbi:M28 family peptidase [Sphingomonas donggukensis]|uniref:Vacuolar membrane protease n=1 Tax=Sphingomonas donggukensis TaxID=2949093 RepID=A0ABY4TXK5_9SPHN|nr:M28 family peptidase [Sphingomonas donggukensis]URW76719.1 M28 family peptidase [Sphingomonas donggukensis]
MARATTIMLAALAAVLIALSFKGTLLTPPPVPAQTAAGAFDANRAQARLERIIGDGAPHPVDSAANDGVRTRILAEMRREGLSPRVTDAVTCNGRATSRAVSCARVRNILADIGPATGPTLLLVAHYDSTPVGPGASDDGVGVASLLEVAHQLRGTTPARGITLLLTDGEEAGLIGARAFLDNDPTARRVTHLVNLESRGVSGPAFMFETSRPNAQPIAAFRAAAARPVANSLSTDFYRLIPNSTDVAVFEGQPWSILNFAIIANETRYHSPGDVPAALDRRSLNHMGTQVLALTRDWAAGRDHAGGGTRIYADVLTRVLIVLPLAVGIGGLALLVVALGVVAWRRGAIGRGLTVPAAAVAVALALGWVGNWIAAAVRTGEYWRGYPHITALAVDAGAVMAAVVMLVAIGRRLEAGQARVGAWLFFVLLGAVACWFAPGAAIYFLIAPAIVLAGMIFGPRVERVAGVVAALWLFVTFAELIAQVELLLVNGPVWATAAVTVLAVLPLLVEARAAGGTLSPRVASIVAAVALVAAWGVVLVTPRSTPYRKARFVVEHIADANAGSARWGLATDGVRLPDSFDRFGTWTSVDVPYSGRRRWVAPAPMTPLPALDAADRQVAAEGTTRRMRFRLQSGGAANVLLQFPADSAIVAIGMAGAPRPITATDASGEYALRCTGCSCEGAIVELVQRGSRPLVVTMTGMYMGLPGAAAPLLAARPANAAAQYTPDARYVIRRVRL